MTAVLTSSPSAILDTYADVIEGGSAYASGTEYAGIPGAHSVLDDHVGTDITASSGTVSTVVSATISDDLAAKLVRTDAPPFFLRCLTQAALTLNVGMARKITAFTASTNTYALDPDWPEAVANLDTFRVEEGFKRSPNRFSLKDEPAEGGFDRFFHLEMLPGRDLDWRGDGTKLKQGTLVLRLQFTKRRADRDLIDAALDNMERIVDVIVRGDMRPTGVQVLVATEAPTREDESEHRIIVRSDFSIIYRTGTDYR